MKQQNFILGTSGVGDIIIFVSYINQIHNHSGNKNYIDFYKQNIINWRNDLNVYYPFMVKYANFLIPNNGIEVKEGIEGICIGTDDIYQYYHQNNIDFKIIDIGKKLNTKKDYNKILIHTKVRNLHRNVYNSIKNDFFDILNNSNKEIIIIGEREVEYGKEYSIHGNQVVYSIYNDIKKNVDPNKTTDLTMPAYGITSPNWDNLLNDMNIIAKHKNICFGSGGVLVLASSLTSGDLLGCVSMSHALCRFFKNPNLLEPVPFLDKLTNFVI